MNRLTETNGNNYIHFVIDNQIVTINDTDILKVAQKLKHYEDLEEQNKLLELPCAKGSTVYVICSRYTKCSKYNEVFDEYSCQGCEDECDSHLEYYIHVNKSVDLEWIVRNMKNFNKTVFLNKEDANNKMNKLNKKRR